MVSLLDTWSSMCSAAKSDAELLAVGEAEDNASATAADDEFAPFSERWAGIAISTYEFLIEQ